jgi:hypothetical protein
MKKLVLILIALLLTISCASVQESKAPVSPAAPLTAPSAPVLAPVVQAPNYSGRWIGQSVIEGQGMIDTLDLTLVHQNGIVTGVVSDSQGYMSNAGLTDVDLKEKTLKFSFIAATPMGSIPVNSIGTFSEDSKELAISFVVTSMNMSGNAKLVRTENETSSTSP